MSERSRGVVYSIPKPGDEQIPAEEFLAYAQKKLLEKGHVGTLLTACDAVMKVLRDSSLVK